MVAIPNDLNYAQWVILKALEQRPTLRVHVAYYAEVFALSCQGLVTFEELREEHWRGFEVRRVE